MGKRSNVVDMSPSIVPRGLHVSNLRHIWVTCFRRPYTHLFISLMMLGASLDPKKNFTGQVRCTIKHQENVYIIPINNNA